MTNTRGAVLFGGIGFGLLAVVILAWRDERRKAVGPSPGDQPWLSRADWASGVVEFSDRKSGRILHWVSGGMLLVSAPALLISSRAVAAGDSLALLGCLPAGLAFFVQWKARKALS